MIHWSEASIHRAATGYAPSTARLWDDVIGLAERYKAIAARDSLPLRVAWHHLVLAVGNFKRQAPIRLEPLPSTPSAEAQNDSHEVWVPEDGGFMLEADGLDAPETWKRLRTVRGIETATATAILAALWPQQHLIFDTWVFNVANAMRADGDSAFLASRANSPYGEISIDVYGEARPMFLDLAQNHHVRLVDIERAAFVIARALGNDPDRTWRDYIAAMNDQLGRA